MKADEMRITGYVVKGVVYLNADHVIKYLLRNGSVAAAAALEDAATGIARQIA